MRWAAYLREGRAVGMYDYAWAVALRCLCTCVWLCVLVWEWARLGLLPSSAPHMSVSMHAHASGLLARARDAGRDQSARGDSRLVAGYGTGFRSIVRFAGSKL